MFATKTSEFNPLRMSKAGLEAYYKTHPADRPIRLWESKGDFEVKNGKHIMKVPPEERYCSGLPGKQYRNMEEWYLDFFIISFRIREVPRYGSWRQKDLLKYQMQEYRESKEAWAGNSLAQQAYDYLIDEALADANSTELIENIV